MSGWHDQEFRERLVAVVKDYVDRQSRRWRKAQPANDVADNETVIPFPQAPRSPMHRLQRAS